MNSNAEQYVENKSPNGNTYVFAEKSIFNHFHPTELKAVAEECHEIIDWAKSKTKRPIDVFLEECRHPETGERMVVCLGEYEDEDKDYISIDLIQMQEKYGKRWKKHKVKDNFAFVLCVGLVLTVLDDKHIAEMKHIVELRAAFYLLQYKLFKLKNRAKTRLKSLFRS